MVRPQFPTIHHESEKLDVNTITEVIVIVDDVWKVGDLVDWLTDGCYWSGKVTKILGNGKIQVILSSSLCCFFFCEKSSSLCCLLILDT